MNLLIIIELLTSFMLTLLIWVALFATIKSRNLLWDASFVANGKIIRYFVYDEF